MNFRYTTIDPCELQSYMHRMTIIDSCQTDHGYAFRIKFFAHGNMIVESDPEYIVLLEAGDGKITARIANFEKDRLPGYPLKKIKTTKAEE